MYDDHYGLSGRPFQLTPDPRFWFDTATHRKAMAYLGYGLSQGEGFVVITGDPGVGKTTLMGHLLGEIDEQRLNVIKIVSTQLRPEDLLQTVCAGLEIDATGASKSAMLAAIEHGLHAVARDGRRTLLIIDEAQALPAESLEELRMLSNFQAGGHALLQIFLLGQPEFRLTLQDGKLEQLRQRVIAMHHLAPMDANELEPYLLHRLSLVGWRGKPRFTNDALTAMHRWSGGIPRRVNQLAGRVLLFGAVEHLDTFGAPELAAVIADLDNDSAAPAAAKRTAPIAEPLELRDIAPMSMGTPTPSAPAEARPLHRETLIVEDPVPVAEAPIDRRIAELEKQLQEQDAALRRVLTLLVDWVESGESERRPDLSSLRGHAA
ncbi:AAA family ATPase [Sphingomonas psychrotolerans]|uniref:AAA family ATPase n=1 Tax=Sphingomonas psychrotolerans TaxID=1327635 RepID=A0ABU3N360_9SPHN|nr:AAA family ATPase [Sphingomonas psychrotolerans]MDT8758207.1 AAA family ATPase [Sphingomonas psychrotolerans]